VPIGVTGRTGSKDTNFTSTLLFVLLWYLKQSLAREKIAVEHVGPKMDNHCSLWALKLSRSKSSGRLVPCGFDWSSRLPNCCWCERKSTLHSLSLFFVLRGSQTRRTSNRNTSLGNCKELSRFGTRCTSGASYFSVNGSIAGDAREILLPQEPSSIASNGGFIVFFWRCCCRRRSSFVHGCLVIVLFVKRSFSSCKGSHPR
jgi:hypothetical protein